jgi:hypothetical protein
MHPRQDENFKLECIRPFRGLFLDFMEGIDLIGIFQRLRVADISWAERARVDRSNTHKFELGGDVSQYQPITFGSYKFTPSRRICWILVRGINGKPFHATGFRVSVVLDIIYVSLTS